MASRLNIYACSGISGGIGAKTASYDYWTDNTQTIRNTQAVNTMLAKINLCVSELNNLELDREQKLFCLNHIDLYCACLVAAQEFSGYPEALHFAGEVIGSILDSFKTESLDNAERDKHLDNLLDEIELIIANKSITAEPSQKFMSWWKTNIEERDKVGLSTWQQGRAEKAIEKAVSGIGAVDESWMRNKDLAEYLTKGSEYFLYTYFTDEQLAHLPKRFARKKKQQLKTYDYCKELFVGVYGSEQEMQDIIRTGIIGYFKATPEQVCARIIKDGSIGLVETVAVAAGWTIAEIIQVISICVAAVVAIITAICTAAKDLQVAKYQAIEKQAVESSVPNADDYEGLDGLDEPSNSNLWLIAGGIVAAFLFLRR